MSDMTPEDLGVSMTLRDWFAGQALAGLIEKVLPQDDPAEIAGVLYAVADAMLAERGN